MADGSAPPRFVSARPRFAVDGAASAALAKSCIRVETLETDAGMSSLEAVFLNLDYPEAGKPVGFLHFDGRTIDLGRAIELAFETGGASMPVFRGFVLALGGSFPEAREPELTVLAEDALARARIRRRTRVSENSDDAAIISAAVTDAGLTANVELAGPTHAQHWQVNQSDLDLLRERAAASDASLRLTDRTLAAGARDRDAPAPIRMSSYNELIRFDVLADLSHQRAAIHVHGWDVANKEAIHETAGSAVARQAMGGVAGRSGADVIEALWSDAVEDVHDAMPATVEEARTVAEARMRARARRFVRGKGVAMGNPKLRVGATVELVDLGPLFTGVYQLTQVRHCFDMVTGYRTHFEASRAALGRAA